MTTDGSAELEPGRAPVDDRADRLAALAHELRAPLTSIEGWVELLLDGALGQLSAEQVRAVEVVGRNAARVRALLAELQAPQAARDPLAVAPGHAAPGQGAVDVTAVVGAAVDLLRPTARLGGVVLDERPSGRRLMVVGDLLRLEGAVVNVLGNAVKYTRRGGGVTVRTFEGGGRVVVEVVDTGIGIPFDELRHLTEPWFRARNATASGIEGDGLGLALVRDVVEAHGGEVSLSSVDGAGTTVRLVLPAAPAAGPPGNAAPGPAV
ncbi:MAG TPA: HAMP domain-containing sensor histidine kinase [Ornithinibacter sp.]|nr:HAMP domain-containing sensor histidine kinase [Ornithinibacter sp.]